MVHDSARGATTDTQARRVRLYGQPNSGDAYTIRDFLMRSVVEFDWIEITDDATCHAALGVGGLSDVRFPVVDLPDRTRLCAPTLREIAERLGWVTQPRLHEYDLSIYGAGPAGLSAAVYAASEGLRTVLIERHAAGGQAGTSSLIENYLGFPDGVSGAALAERARQQAVKFDVELLMMREGVKAEFRNDRIYVDLAGAGTLVARSNLCTTGVEYRRLAVPGEERFLRAGLYYGAGVSEAAFCQDEHVLVVGGGNSAGQAVMHFARYARKVTMIVRGPSLSATLSDYLLGRITTAPNVEVLYNVHVSTLDGDALLRRVEITDGRSGAATWLDTQYLFICIGGVPNTEWAQDTAIMRDPAGYLLTGPDLMEGGKRPPAGPSHAPRFSWKQASPARSRRVTCGTGRCSASPPRWVKAPWRSRSCIVTSKKRRNRRQQQRLRCSASCAPPSRG